jgi:hypothetical protein
MLFPVGSFGKSIAFFLHAKLCKVYLSVRALLKADVTLAVVAVLAFRKALPPVHTKL